MGDAQARGQVVGGRGWGRASQIVTRRCARRRLPSRSTPLAAIERAVVVVVGKCPPGGRDLNREVLGEVVGEASRPGPDRGCWLSVVGRRLGSWTKRAEDFKNDPMIVPIHVPPAGSFEDYFAGLERGEEPTVLSVSATQLVAD